MRYASIHMHKYIHIYKWGHTHTSGYIYIDTHWVCTFTHRYRDECQNKLWFDEAIHTYTQAHTNIRKQKYTITHLKHKHMHSNTKKYTYSHTLYSQLHTCIHP